MVYVFCDHIDVLTPNLESFADFIYGIIVTKNKDLSKIGLQGLFCLLDRLGGTATSQMWDVMLAVIKKIFGVTTHLLKCFINGAISAAAETENIAPVTEVHEALTPRSQTMEIELEDRRC